MQYVEKAFNLRSRKETGQDNKTCQKCYKAYISSVKSGFCSPLNIIASVLASSMSFPYKTSCNSLLQKGTVMVSQALQLKYCTY